LKHYLRSNNIELDHAIDDDRLSAFISGFQRSVSDAREHGEMNVDEGKQPLTFVQYQFLATLTLTKNKHTVSNHTHLLMQFNGMSRNGSIAAMS